MATLSESVGGLLDQFSFIFIFLLVFAIVFGILSYMNPLKDEKRGLYAIISFVLAILVSISANAVMFVKTITVWFFALALFVFLLIFVFGLFGLKEDNWSQIIRRSDVHTWVVIIGIIIVLFALGSAFGQNLLEKGTGDNGERVNDDSIVTVDDYNNDVRTASSASNDYGDNVLKTFMSPKVLGLLVVFLISLFAILFLTKPP